MSEVGGRDCRDFSIIRSYRSRLGPIGRALLPMFGRVTRVTKDCIAGNVVALGGGAVISVAGNFGGEGHS